MFLSTLQLYNFRNYPELSVTFEEPLALLLGGNAQGKTNLLEAIALVAITRSPRTPTSQELIRFGATEARVVLELGDDQRRETLEARLQTSPVDGRVLRQFRVNGRPVPAHDAAGRLRVVLFWPEDLQAVKGGGDLRRRLLNDLLTQVDRPFARQLSQYERILDQRNALLRQVREGAQPVSALGYWTGELARAGAPLVQARLRHLRRLAPLVASEYAALSGEQEALEVDYLAKRYLLTEAMSEEAEGLGWGAEDEPSALRASLLQGLHEAAAEEVARGMTVVGPHRDDLRVRVGGREARVFASQGQQRSAMLSWKLAEVAYITQCTGSPPLLLLDDVLSELDWQRRTALLLALARAGQTLVTTCESSDLPESWLQRGARWRVRAGAMTRDA